MIDTNKPVSVYYNSHRGLYSVRQNGIVVAHVDNIILHNCTFVVKSKGRDRVRLQKKKNVHAWITGMPYTAREANRRFTNDEEPPFVEVFYNPYKNDTFVDGDGHPIFSAEFVDMDLRHELCHPVIAFGEINGLVSCHLCNNGRKRKEEN